SAPECAARLPKSNGSWTDATGCGFAAVTRRYSLARRRRDLQLLPAYGLQELQIKNPNPKPRSKPNASPLPITLGGNLGSGHFYLAENRTFLLCVDTPFVDPPFVDRVKGLSKCPPLLSRQK